MSQRIKSQQEISQDIKSAMMRVEIGAVYRHYKDEDKMYCVNAIGLHTETNDLYVIYQAQYGERITFVRPLSVWLETISWQGKLVSRFVKADKR